jgi:hypothetical protein
MPMSRGTQVIWPALALVTSFIAVFALTWVFSTQRSSEPPPSAPVPTAGSPSPLQTPPTPERNVLAVTIVGREAQPVQENPSPNDPVVYPVVPGVLERHGVDLCLVASFAQQGWRPEDERQWRNQDQTWCQHKPIGEPLELTFVRK